ncbi:MAG: autotransporter assembly complex protein TamA [Acinetobacter populi]|jgi:translocation and assembly module TamA|uniref:autotransporter assembly complex protein TamA n=1 Tax=Acinetobacter populi TaxID=1582270 RepID=UPI002357A8B1|nr:autotransporter assembly complex family protein [Acinetobacter populi]MCH4249038.1 autotransporter assembly complex protein TamA [Acinetobacter populi]
MPNPNKKILNRSLLAVAIDDLLYVSRHGKTVLLGISCVFSTLSYAEDMVLSSPDSSLVDTAIEKHEQQQTQQIQDALQQQAENAQTDQQNLNTALQEFQTEAVYQLNDADIPPVDQNMLNEINQIAAEAQQEAKQQEQQLPTVQQAINAQKTDSSSQEAIFVEPQEQQAKVDQLMQELQADQIELPQFQASGSSEDPSNPQTSAMTETKKRGFFARLFRRGNDNNEQVEALPKINVTVTGTSSEPDEALLAENIDAKLSTFTVDAFEDFNVALPQIRNMATLAAQAVGYYESEFKFTKKDENDLVVDVKPKEPVTVKSQLIEFSGAGATRPAFQVISVVPDLNEGDVFNHGLYETTKNRISSAASDQGYFDAYWRMHDAKVTLPENTADISLKYETGERYVLNGVEFRMSDPDKPFPLRRSVLEKLVPFKEGDDYTSWRVSLLSNNLINSRYFNYALVNVIKPDPIDKPLELPDDVKEILQQSQAQQNDATTSENNDQLAVESQQVVDETVFAGAQDDQTLKTASDADTSQNDDENEQLKAKAREEKKIPVIVYLNADTLNNLETGIGYGTDTGVRLRTQYRRSIVNDRGHSFDANMELSQVRQSIDGRYMIPYKDPLNDYFNIVGGYEREVRGDIGQGVELDIESAVVGAERTIKRPLGEWQHNLSVRYRLDRITTKGDNIDYDDIPDAFKVISSDPEQESLLFGYEISRTNQDNRVNPTKGFRQFYRAEAGSKSLLTETDMAILSAGWRFIYSLGENADHQFVGRGDLGYIVTDNFDQVPYNLRYFAGGDQSIRGYDYKSLSPKEDDLLLGGQVLAVGSLEYNYQFKEGWRAAVFTDVGNAYDKDFKTETKYGVGLGLRWASPIGPIRIDVGAGISEDSIPIRLHFFIGPPL